MNPNEPQPNTEASATAPEPIPPPPPIMPDLNAPIFFIEDKSNQDNEAQRNSRKKLTGDMDLISHFGLYYLYEMSRNKPVDYESDYNSYIEDIPIKQIIKNTTIKDLIMAPPTQRIPILPFDQDTLDNAYTLRPGPFPQDPSLDTSYFSNSRKKLQSQSKESEEIKQEEESNDSNNNDNHADSATSDTNKIQKVTLKINMTYNDYDKPKKKRSYTADPEESEKLKKKHKKKKV